MGALSFVDDRRVRSAAGAVAGVLGFYFVIQWFWPAPIGVLVQGLVIGGLTALIAFGIALTYRANRIVNFAGGDLGALPASLAVLLMVSNVGLPYFLAVPIGLVGAMALGALVDFLLIRRFFRAPRLILTVVTIGISQLLAGLAFILPAAFDITTPPQNFPSPFDFTFHVWPGDRTVFHGNDLIAMIAVVALVVGLGAFFRYTNVGIAIRASAEGAERASLLGVPVKRIETVVWVVAAMLSFAGVFLRAGVVGLPFGQLVGPALLVRALAAAVIGKMERFSVILVASLGLGVLESAVIFSSGRASIVDPILFVVIVVAMLLRKAGAPSRTDERSSWQSSKDVRPVPRELAHFPEIRWGLRGLQVGVLAIVLLLPLVLDVAQINLATVIALSVIVGLSLVLLTGWAGQVSLGQFAFFGIGAAIASHITTALHWDLSVAIVAAGFVGAAAAMVIGIPALRIRGLYLAVITLSFALATSAYILNPEYMHWLPKGRFDRPPLFGRISLDSEVRYYYFAIAAVLLTLAALRGLRRSRTGRVLIGIRENERAAQAFGVNAVSAKLTAFALAGFLSASAGAIFVHQQQSLAFQSYGVAKSFQVFIEVVLGGLGSPLGAILGVGLIEGINYFKNAFPETIRLYLAFFTSSVGLIFVLLALPGGLAEAVYMVRDRLLRAVADRRGVMVPSLVADGRVEGAPGGEAVDEALLLLGDDLVLEPTVEEPPAPPPRRREPLRAGRS